MDEELRKLLDEYKHDVPRLYKFAGVTAATVKPYILAELEIAIGARDRDAYDTLFAMACSIENPVIKADTLNGLLVMPGHEHHQRVTMEIQRLRSPSSVPFIRAMFERGFESLEYTCSEDGAIAKWFSHALAKIGTPEAISLIIELADSDNAEIASEMAYRLGKLNT